MRFLIFSFLLCAGLTPQSVFAESTSLQDQINSLEEALVALTGSLERLQYQQQQQDTTLSNTLKDLSLRLSELEAKVGSQTGVTIPAKPAAQPQTPTPAPASSAAPAPQSPAVSPAVSADSPQTLYNDAYKLLTTDKNFNGAETAFKAFLSQYPRHGLAGNAQYWLGEVYYGRGEFDKAAIAFADGYKNYPTVKRPDNLLKLGLSMQNLGKKVDACTAYRHLMGDMEGVTPYMKNVAQDNYAQLQCRE